MVCPLSKARRAGRPGLDSVPFWSVCESVSAVTANQPPRTLYAGLMVLVGLTATAVAFVAARAVGGPEAPALEPALLVAGVSVLGLLPVLVRSAERFGLAVLGASVFRLLLAMFGALVLTEVSGLESRPVWLGVVAGAGLMLMAETAAAVAILASLERKKAGLAGVEPGSSC